MKTCKTFSNSSCLKRFWCNEIKVTLSKAGKVSIFHPFFCQKEKENGGIFTGERKTNHLLDVFSAPPLLGGRDTQAESWIPCSSWHCVSHRVQCRTSVKDPNDQRSIQDKIPIPAPTTAETFPSKWQNISIHKQEGEQLSDSNSTQEWTIILHF